MLDTWAYRNEEQYFMESIFNSIENTFLIYIVKHKRYR